jgi:hypothetical protein
LTKLLQWLATNCVSVGKYFLSALGAVMVAALGTAIPQLRWSSRIPSRVAMGIGIVTAFLGTCLAITKAIQAAALSPLSWHAPEIIGSVALGFIATAYALRKQYQRRWTLVLQPMIEVALRAIDQRKID